MFNLLTILVTKFVISAWFFCTSFFLCNMQTFGTLLSLIVPHASYLVSFMCFRRVKRGNKLSRKTCMARFFSCGIRLAKYILLSMILVEVYQISIFRIYKPSLIPKSYGFTLYKLFTGVSIIFYHDSSQLH